MPEIFKDSEKYKRLDEGSTKRLQDKNIDK